MEITVLDRQHKVSFGLMMTYEILLRRLLKLLCSLLSNSGVCDQKMVVMLIRGKVTYRPEGSFQVVAQRSSCSRKRVGATCFAMSMECVSEKAVEGGRKGVGKVDCVGYN